MLTINTTMLSFTRKCFLVGFVLNFAIGFPSLSISTRNNKRTASRQLYQFVHPEETDGARRRLVTLTSSVTLLSFLCEPPTALAAPLRRSTKQKKKSNTTTFVESPEPADLSPDVVLSSERYLLQLLPVKNSVFLKLVGFVESLNALRSTSIPTSDTWRTVHKTMGTALEYLDNQRRQLEPIFDQEDSTVKQIRKGERGERLAESLREELVALVQCTYAEQMEDTFIRQKKALLILADIGELLVPSFPYKVPTEGKFANLPRLVGRARVTFTFRRGIDILGNVTIMADGFAAPITAGNFVDLSVRNFYTGLPIKTVKKKLVGGAAATARTGFLGLESFDFDTSGDENSITSIPILGSFREGFFDPLTAKLRRIPLEIVRMDKLFGVFRLTYAKGFSEPTSDDESLNMYNTNKPVLSFDIPGLVAMNHPDRMINGGSSEFFSLQPPTYNSDKDQALLDGQYAPFGYIIDGYDIFQSLKASDVIESTMVEEWGQGNLVKVKGNSFSDVLGELDDDGTGKKID